MENWGKVRSYQCLYRAVTFHEGERKETILTYSYEKPGKIRMDIQKPRPGAVLLYNPDISKKVKVRPFPGLKFFILNYDLTDKRVKADSGGTVAESDLGHRMGGFCAMSERQNVRVSEGKSAEWEGIRGTEFTVEEGGPNPERRRFFFDGELFLRKIEVLDARGSVSESFEWRDLKTGVSFPAGFFEKF